MTRRDERVAGTIALVTAALLIVSLTLSGSGPRNPDTMAAWYANNDVLVRAGALAWLVAMLGLVAFAVRLRDALLGLTADRWWTGVLFVQGAAVFATVAVIAAATAWTAATLAGDASVDSDAVAALGTLHRTLLRFATWGLIVPLLAVGLTLARHSVLGIVAATLGVLVSLALLVPATWALGLPAFSVWLVLTGIALLLSPSRNRSPHGGLIEIERSSSTEPDDGSM
jgi:hypothetical protein